MVDARLTVTVGPVGFVTDMPVPAATVVICAIHAQRSNNNKNKVFFIFKILVGATS